jgi:arylsulfatase
MPWELYDLRTDRSQSTDVAAQHPDVVRLLEQLWFAEAGKYGVFPIHSRVKNGQTPRPDADRTGFTYWAGTSTIPNDVAPRTLQRPFTVRGEFTLTDESDEGVVIAQGGKFGGWSVFVQDGRVHYEYNYLGLDRYRVASEPLGVGAHTVDLAVELSGEFEIAPTLTALGMRGRGGRVTMVVDGGDARVLEVTRMIPFNYSLTGEGLCCGFDSETPVSDRYESPYPFTGEIAQVVLSVEGTVTPNPAKDAERARLVQ